MTEPIPPPPKPIPIKDRVSVLFVEKGNVFPAYAGMN